MIRDYLPYQSAREYIDRGMVKWTGFFLSEHNSALEMKGKNTGIPDEMPIEELAISLKQAYLSGFVVEIFSDSIGDFLIGKIVEIFEKNIYFREEGKIYEIELEDIRTIQLVQYS